MCEPRDPIIRVGYGTLMKVLKDTGMELRVSGGRGVEQREILLRSVYMAMRGAERKGHIMSADTGVAQRARRRSTFKPQGTTHRTDLTEREKDVLLHLALDKSNKEIAAVLGISPLTAKNHVQKILAVYGCRTRLGATMYALIYGDLKLDELREAYGCEDSRE